MSVTPQQALADLEAARDELVRLSEAVFKIGQQLDGINSADEGIEKQYQDFIDDWETGLWMKSQEEGGPKFPSEALRAKLARREMPAEILARRDLLVRKRDRIRQRISDVKATVEANRSILSALKEEAMGAGLKRAA